MAEQQSVVKPKGFVEEYCIPGHTNKKIAVKDYNLYEVDIKKVDRENKSLLIHYKGYSDSFNEWRPFGHEDGYFPFIQTSICTVA